MEARIGLRKTVQALDAKLMEFATGTTNAMYAFKDSVQNGFDNIKKDISGILTTLQRFNERLSAVESTIKEDEKPRLPNLESEIRFLLEEHGYTIEEVGVLHTEHDIVSYSATITSTNAKRLGIKIQVVGSKKA